VFGRIQIMMELQIISIVQMVKPLNYSKTKTMMVMECQIFWRANPIMMADLTQ
jgi:hypothetical protein